MEKMFEVLKGKQFAIKSEVLVGDMLFLQEIGLLSPDEDNKVVVRQTTMDLFLNNNDLTLKFCEVIFELSENDKKELKKRCKEINIKQVFNGYKDFFVSLMAL